MDSALVLDEIRKRVKAEVLYSLYTIHSVKSQIAAKMMLSGNARKETGKFPVISCVATANVMYPVV